MNNVPNDLIYNQNDIPKEQWRYGLRSSAATGCGWIATYNALRLMGYRTQIEPLIRAYERQLPMINGNIGTILFCPAIQFRKWGFPVKTVFDSSKFDEAAKEADACLLFYHWLDKWKYGCHFVALHHTENGFIGYNTYRNSKGPDRYGDRLEVFLKKRKYFGAVLFALKRKDT